MATFFLLLVSPVHVAQMLEIQPHRSIGQSLRCAVQHLIDTKGSFHFHHTWSPETPTIVTLLLGPKSNAKRLSRKLPLPLLDYLLIEVLHQYVHGSLSKTSSDVTSVKPGLVESVWQHLLTRFVFQKCSPLVLSPATSASVIKDLSSWSDEQACLAVQRLIDVSIQCANHDGGETTDQEIKPRDYAHANEYLVSALQKMATTGVLLAN